MGKSLLKLVNSGYLIVSEVAPHLAAMELSIAFSDRGNSGRYRAEIAGFREF